MRQVKSARQRLNMLASSPALQSPVQYVNQRRKSLQLLENRLAASGKHFISAKRRKYISLAAKLDAMSPLKVLARGYAMVSDGNGQVIRSAHQPKIGSSIQIELVDGALEATVTDVKEQS